MILKIDKFETVAKDIKKNKKKIVLFGAGVIGMTVTSYILNEFSLQGFVLCCVDNDKSRWGSEIVLAKKKIQIVSPNILNELDLDVVIWINISRYFEVVKQLDAMESNRNRIAYIIPMLCIENFKMNKSIGIIQESKMQQIPKKIHYVWLGKNNMPERLKKCIDSWKKYCPDYEIICWNENNYDVNKIQYMKDAYRDGKYGFVPDYARLDILYNHGGIYLDTDVEIIKPLDDLLYQEAFCSVEKWQVINFGGCSGAIMGHPAIKKFLDAWEKRMYFKENGKPDTLSSGIIDTQVAIDNGYIINGENQNIMGMNIYTYDYFHPYDYMSGKLNITDNTYSIHHFNGGWLDEPTKSVNIKTTENYDMLFKRITSVSKIS